MRGDDMESLLRQWGGASSSNINSGGGFGVGTGSGYQFGESNGDFNHYFDNENNSSIASGLSLDAPALFRNTTADGVGGNGIGIGSTVVNNGTRGGAAGATREARHRRVASTGGVPFLSVATTTATTTASPTFSSRVLERAESAREGMTLPTDTTTEEGEHNNNDDHDDEEGEGVHPLDGQSSAIHDAARITNWNLVASLTKSDPSAAKYAGPDRWTALHHACSRRCPYADVIEVLLRAYPEAILQTDDRGWNPLHHACRFKAPREVVRLLLRAYPELGKRAASGRCSMGRSPLYYAIRYEAPEGVVDMLLVADPGAVLDEDRDGVCPLGLVWDKYAGGFDGKRVLHALLKPFEGEGWELGGNHHHENNHGDHNYYYEEAMARRMEALAVSEKRVKEAMKKPACRQLRAKWQKVNCLLRAYFHFPLQDDDGDDDGSEELDNTKLSMQSTEGIGGGVVGTTETTTTTISRKRKWRVLHAVSAIKCHHMLFLLARALHPEEAREMDENDLLGGGRDVNSIPEPQSSPNADRQIISSRTALHFAAMSSLSGKEGRNVIKILLSLNPNAPKVVDGYGSLPLHLLAQNDRKVHWTQDGLRDVYNTYAEASLCRDGLGRTPLHCAASAAGHHTRLSAGPSSPTQAARPPSPTAAAGSAQPAALAAGDTARDLGSVIRNLVLVNPTAASVADNTGRLPLHYVAEHGEEWNSDAECILAAHPAASRVRAGSSASDRLPLHMAASSTDARPSLIMNLVHANPRAASLVDRTGRLPLHLACESGRTTWDRGIEAIYSAFTPAISAPEDSPRRWTVLHTAAASPSAGLELIEEISRLYPSAASMADGEGRYPLHLACFANRSWEEGGVRILFEADPSAALVEDKHGLLPFHIAAMRSSDEVILRDDTSDSGNTVDHGDDTVDDLSTLELLYNLLAAQPSIVQL